MSEKESIKHKLKALFEFIWDAELSSLSSLRRLGVKTLRILHLVYRGFMEDECALHSSALTFSSLMAIVPVLALSLALARGFGDVDMAKEKIREAVVEWTSAFKAMPGGPNASDGVDVINVSAQSRDTFPGIADAINSMVDRVFAKVENIKFKAIGGVGLVVLLLMAIDVLGRIEAAFNRVWAVKKSRSLFRKFTDYLSVVMVLPVLIIAASSLPVVSLILKFLDETVAGNLQFIVGSAVIKNTTTIFMATLGFSFLLIFMPNTKVKAGPGLLGGFVTAMLFIGWLWICAALQINVANYGKIYGSFAVVPILLAWVYVSWGIVLFGAEVAFAVQNCSSYRMEQGARKATIEARMIMALSIILEAARALAGKGLGFEVARYAERKRIPVRFINEVVEDLVQSGLLAELSEKSGKYVLLKVPSLVKVRDVVDVVVRSGSDPANLGLGTVDPCVERIVKKASDGLNTSISQTSIQELMNEQ
ncbi:MAG: hypothetical protein A2283_19795 [Lentisphaerae bacterium RIFOXYA12_FULL_48_11]|nr:MAG: hypothetical protein A2283_19795 [Lentisphaerae bacterium RIFOXYA12_FULL_48_11]